MNIYKLTAYEKKGKVILDETIEAANDEEAIEKGQAILEEKELLQSTHRLTSSKGKLLLFHS